MHAFLGCNEADAEHVLAGSEKAMQCRMLTTSMPSQHSVGSMNASYVWLALITVYAAGLHAHASLKMAATAGRQSCGCWRRCTQLERGGAVLVVGEVSGISGVVMTVSPGLLMRRTLARLPKLCPK